MVNVHKELKLPKGGMEVPIKGNKRSRRCFGSPRRIMEVLKGLEVSRGKVEVPKKRDGGPQGTQMWTGGPQGLDSGP